MMFSVLAPPAHARFPECGVPSVKTVWDGLDSVDVDEGTELVIPWKRWERAIVNIDEIADPAERATAKRARHQARFDMDDYVTGEIANWLHETRFGQSGWTSRHLYSLPPLHESRGPENDPRLVIHTAVLYKGDASPVVVTFNSWAFLMNDQGNTVERVGPMG